MVSVSTAGDARNPAAALQVCRTATGDGGHVSTGVTDHQSHEAAQPAMGVREMVPSSQLVDF